MSYPSTAQVEKITDTQSNSNDPLRKIKVVSNQPPVFTKEVGKYSETTNSGPIREPKLRLGTNSSESRDFENLSNLYSILLSLEHIESAFLSDLVTYEEYYKHCSGLLQKYRMWFNANEALVHRGIYHFMDEYGLNAPLGMARILDGSPAELENTAPDSKRAHALLVSITEIFITTMDAINLEMYSVDTLEPNLSSLIKNLHQLKPTDDSKTVVAVEPCVVKIHEWRDTLQLMGAADELDGAQPRQLLHDLSTCFNWFKDNYT